MTELNYATASLVAMARANDRYRAAQEQRKVQEQKPVTVKESK